MGAGSEYIDRKTLEECRKLFQAYSDNVNNAPACVPAKLTPTRDAAYLPDGSVVPVILSGKIAGSYCIVCNSGGQYIAFGSESKQINIDGDIGKQISLGANSLERKSDRILRTNSNLPNSGTKAKALEIWVPPYNLLPNFEIVPSLTASDYSPFLGITFPTELDPAKMTTVTTCGLTLSADGKNIYFSNSRDYYYNPIGGDEGDWLGITEICWGMIKNIVYKSTGTIYVQQFIDSADPPLDQVDPPFNHFFANVLSYDSLVVGRSILNPSVFESIIPDIFTQPSFSPVTPNSSQTSGSLFSGVSINIGTLRIKDDGTLVCIQPIPVSWAFGTSTESSVPGHIAFCDTGNVCGARTGNIPINEGASRSSIDLFCIIYNDDGSSSFSPSINIQRNDIIEVFSGFQSVPIGISCPIGTILPCPTDSPTYQETTTTYDPLNIININNFSFPSAIPQDDKNYIIFPDSRNSEVSPSLNSLYYAILFNLDGTFDLNTSSALSSTSRLIPGQGGALIIGLDNFIPKESTVIYGNSYKEFKVVRNMLPYNISGDQLIPGNYYPGDSTAFSYPVIGMDIYSYIINSTFNGTTLTSKDFSRRKERSFYGEIVPDTAFGNGFLVEKNALVPNGGGSSFILWNAIVYGFGGYQGCTIGTIA